MSRHQCPIGDCTILLPAAKLMCLVHWRKVPQALREEVIAAYDHGAGLGSGRLGHAQSAAILAVEAKLTGGST